MDKNSTRNLNFCGYILQLNKILADKSAAPPQRKGQQTIYFASKERMTSLSLAPFTG